MSHLLAVFTEPINRTSILKFFITFNKYFLTECALLSKSFKCNRVLDMIKLFYKISYKI